MARKTNQRQGCLFDGGEHAKPVLVSACLLGIPCRWHGRRPKKRDRTYQATAAAICPRADLS